MESFQFNTIVILDFLPTNEQGSVYRLRENLRDISYYHDQTLKVEYHRINHLYDIEFFLLSTLKKIVLRNNYYPLLHFEGHGLDDRSGIRLPDGKNCSWRKLVKILIPINEALCLNLFIVLATCYGGSFEHAIDIQDAAPVWGLVGPNGEINAGGLEDNFYEFYKVFFSTFSGNKALQTLNKNIDIYNITSASYYFKKAWTNYKLVHCAQDNLRRRAQDIIDKTIKDDIFLSQDNIIERIVNDEANYYERVRRKFFMLELCEKNEARFSLSYQEADNFVNEYRSNMNL